MGVNSLVFETFLYKFMNGKICMDLQKGTPTIFLATASFEACSVLENFFSYDVSWIRQKNLQCRLQSFPTPILPISSHNSLRVIKHHFIWNQRGR